MILKQIILDLINTNIRNKLPKVIKSEHANVEEALLDAIFIPYEVKQLDCPQQFINDNFDLTPGSTMGLGKNLMIGFAMSNGNNGTQDRRKRTSVGYDPRAYVSGTNFSIIGDTGGSEDSILVAHTHTVNQIKSYNAAFGTNGFYDRSQGAGSNGITTESAGESGEGKNMPPFIVTLFIQRV